MNKLVLKVLDTIDKYNMITRGQTVIAAVSGGYDSMCMLYALYDLRALRGFDMCVAHVNHDFRKEADADCSYVGSVCEKLNIPFYHTKVNVEKYAKEKGISFETAGREVRYSFFEEVGKNYGDCVIATAHNANDSIESFFMHLTRGSGLSGLKGIAPVRNGIIRPLIETERKDIEEYCNSLGIEIRHDSTNQSDDYTRNDIRHNVVAPVLERCSAKSLLRTMEVIAQEDSFMEEYALSVRDKYILCAENEWQIDVKKFNPLPVGLKRRLIKSVLPYNNTGLVHIDECIEMAKNNRGGKKSSLPNGVKIEINKGILKISKK